MFLTTFECMYVCIHVHMYVNVTVLNKCTDYPSRHQAMRTSGDSLSCASSRPLAAGSSCLVSPTSDAMKFCRSYSRDTLKHTHPKHKHRCQHVVTLVTALAMNMMEFARLRKLGNTPP